MSTSRINNIRALANVLAANHEFFDRDALIPGPVWAILTGLRGPDREPAFKAKEQTAGVIRAVICPDLCSANGAITASDDDVFILRGKDVEALGYHYCQHAIDAAFSLGLLSYRATPPQYEERDIIGTVTVLQARRELGLDQE